MKGYFLTLLFSLLMISTFAQQFPERRLIRQGNREFSKEDFVNSEVSYLRALQKDTASYEANFNLSDVMYKQERYEDAEKRFERMSRIETDTLTRSSAYFNLGNSLFQQKKYKEALEAYKNAMRQDPNDTQAKFNYAYTKKMIEDDQNDDNQNDQDNNSDNNQDNQDQNQDPNQDQQQQDDNKDQNQDDNNSQDQQQQPPPQGGMSREEAERMLEAIQNSEDNTREKVDAQEAQAAARSNKNW